MNKIKLTLGLLLFCSISLNAQKSNTISTNLPVSIYTYNQLSNTSYSFSKIFKNLKLTDYSFVFVDQLDLYTNTFSINFNDIDKQPSIFIYDDYKRYQNNNLLKGFLVKNDPTRWDRVNFKSYNQLKKELN
ncbi:MAG: hypothetical protein V3V28_09735 [Polaribacter sp.]|uniref:hypothetical protein n=1 Tax=Polaribacter sp. TaxID=1920175 RepID=UPI002F358057